MLSIWNLNLFGLRSSSVTMHPYTSHYSATQEETASILGG